MRLSAVLRTLVVAMGGARAWNPSNTYAPARVACPADVGRGDGGGRSARLVRDADSVPAAEAAWVDARRVHTDRALATFLARTGVADVGGSGDSAAAEAWLADAKEPVRVGLAFSGGGYRAMLAGAGQFAALDARTPGATAPGHLGGLVQGATYMAGLSGGAWLVGSVALNNFSTIDALRSPHDGGSGVWDLRHSIFNPGGANVLATAGYYSRLVGDVGGKARAGFNTTVTDMWGRMLSQQFVGVPGGGPAMAWSDIQQHAAFAAHEMPLPIVLANGRAPETKIISTNSTVFEISPFELGSWDPSLRRFANLTWLGSDVYNGLPQGPQCVLGFDQAGFVMGTSSSLFNFLVLRLNTTDAPPFVRAAAESVISTVDVDSVDTAVYKPNPFLGAGSGSIARADYLSLVDAGEDRQNVPFYPLVQPQRRVDAVLAFDNSANTPHSWPNGSSLEATFRRQFGAQRIPGVAFPSVPDSRTFLNKGMSQRPVFLGCYASNFTTESTDDAPAYIPPVIVYTSNSYYTYFSNTSTFKMRYDDAEKHGIIQNTYATATYGNGTLDAEYPACVGCALIQRELERRGTPQSPQCRACFARYCWDGSLDQTPPTDRYLAQLDDLDILDSRDINEYI